MPGKSVAVQVPESKGAFVRLADRFVISEDASNVVQSVVDKILSAETEDELFAEQAETWDLEDLVGGGKIEFRSVRAALSTLSQSQSDVFVIAEVRVVATGEEGVLTTGAVNVTTQLLRANELGLLPIELLVTFNVTRDGNKVYRLVKPKASDSF